MTPALTPGCGTWAPLMLMWVVKMLATIALQSIILQELGQGMCGQD